MSNENENITVTDESIPSAQAEKESSAQKTANADTAAADNGRAEVAENKATVGVKKLNGGSSARSGGMSRLFKLVYFPLVALLAVIMLVFSIVDGVCGYKPKAFQDGFYTAVKTNAQKIAEMSRTDMSGAGASAAADYIYDILSGNGFKAVEEEKSGDEGDEDLKTVTAWANDSQNAVATVTKFTAVLSAEAQADSGKYLVGKQITDIVAAIPSEKTKRGETADSVIVTVRYDSRADSPEAANASFIAAVMQTLIEYAGSDSFQNDFVVIFTEDMGGAYGTYAFFDAFEGLDNVASRAKAGLNLEAYGNSGTLALTDSSRASLDYINAYTKVSGTAFNSTVTDGLPSELKNTVALDAFGDVPVIQVAVVGGIENSQSALDTYGDLPESTIYEQSAFFKNYIEAFSVNALDYGDAKADVYFSYFDWGTVAYNNVASYVISAILLAVIVAVIVLNVVKKTFSTSRMVKSIFVQLAIVAGSVVALFAAYFLVALMLTGFGVIPIHAILQVRYFNAGIIIAALLVTLAATFGFTNLFKKFFKVTASDLVRGTALLIGFAGAILGFAVPAYSYILSWLGLLMCATLLVTVLVNGKFKERFGFGMDRLFLFAIPVALCMPLTMAATSMLATVQPLYMLPLIMSVFAAMLGVAVPYLDRTAVVFDKVAKKLPMRTQRVERTVTEKVEDRAKKGKFTERTVKRVDKEKVPVNYKNYFGISLLAVLGCVVALFSGGFGATFAQTVTQPYAYENSVYNDSLVYEWDKTGGSVKQTVVVSDLVAYKYIRYAVSGLQWDATKNRYYKTVNYNASDIVPTTPEIKRGDDDVYTVTTFDGPRSAVTITIPSASGITKITVTSTGDSGKNYVYNFDDVNEIVLKLPYGFGNFIMEFEGTKPTTVKYEERSAVTVASSNNPLANVDEWNSVLQYYNGTELVNLIRGGLVLKTTATF